VDISAEQRRQDFSIWIRTGRRPRRRDATLELKFNPWHDPADGRFTFAGSGSNYGAGGKGSANRASGRAPVIGDRENPPKPRLARTPKAKAPRARPAAGNSGKPADHSAKVQPRPIPKVQPKPVPKSRPSDRPNSVGEFVAGFGDGLYDFAKETATGVYSVLTTNPVTTVRNFGHGIAGAIDTAIAAEDTPARIQVARAAQAIANASPRDLGHATGSIAANAVLAVAPEAALAKASALRRLRSARPRPTYDPPQIGWAKEKLKGDEPWVAYNDAANGARPGQAPTLMRTMPDGSKRPVKFDGIRGDYVIDRKWKVVNAPNARAQVMRQSQVLAEHRLIGVWEVRNNAQKVKALKLLKQMNVVNINVKVVAP